MEIAQLEAFERAAREGNFTRAAVALGLTQPAVSMRITSLEAELNGKLFERRGRHLYLTPLGERFLPYARRTLAVLEDGLQEISHYHSGSTGQVRLAAPTPFLLSFMVDTLGYFRQQHPQVDVLIRERNKTTIFEMLDDRAITLGLVNAPVFDGRFLQILRLHDPIRAVAAASHPLALEEEPLHLRDLYRHTIFRVSMFPAMTAFMDGLMEDARQATGAAVLAIPMVMARRLVLTGQGITFLPQSYIQPAVSAGEMHFLEIVDLPPLVSEPVLIARREDPLDKVHQEFARILKATWRHLIVN